MLDNIAQILHRLEIAVGAVLENSEAFRRRVRKYGIVVRRSFVKNQSQLFIVALYSQQLASPGGQLFENILAGLALEKIDIFVFVYFILEPREAIHIAV